MALYSESFTSYENSRSLSYLHHPDVLQAEDAPNKFFFYEVYENAEAIAHHKVRQIVDFGIYLPNRCRLESHLLISVNANISLAKLGTTALSGMGGIQREWRNSFQCVEKGQREIYDLTEYLGRLWRN